MKMKSRKPEFVPQDSWKQKRVRAASWRRPKGLHSKMRLNFRGNPKMPSPGFRAPLAARGMHPSGTFPLLVSTPAQLENTEAKAIIISSSTGAKKKIEIIKKAAGKSIEVLNINAEEFVKKAEAVMAEKKRAKAAKPEHERKPRPGKQKEAGKEEGTEEDKRKEARKEMERIITKPN